MGSVDVVFDALLSDPIQIDIEQHVFHAWLHGITLDELLAELPAMLAKQFVLTVPPLSRSRSTSTASSVDVQDVSPNDAYSPNSPQLSRRASRDDPNETNAPETNPSRISEFPHGRSSSIVSENFMDNNLQFPSRKFQQSQSYSLLSSPIYERLVKAATTSLRTQYRSLSLLEHSLRRPALLDTAHCPLQIGSELAWQMVIDYYTFDSRIMRNLCGVKISKLHRKDATDLSARLNIRETSGLRQLDNLRRIYRARWPDNESVGQMDTEKVKERERVSRRWKQMRAAASSLAIRTGASASNNAWLDDDDIGGINTVFDGSTPTILSLMQYYHFPRPLASAYMKMIFLCHYRFECLQKRLNILSFQDLLTIAYLLMRYWAIPFASDPAANVLSPSITILPTILPEPTPSAVGAGLGRFYSAISSVLGNARSSPSSISHVETTYSLAIPTDYPLGNWNEPKVTLFEHDETIEDWIGDTLDVAFIQDLADIKLNIVDNKKLLDEYCQSTINILRIACGPMSPSTSANNTASPRETTSANISDSASTLPPTNPTLTGQFSSFTGFRISVFDKIKIRVPVIIKSLLAIAFHLPKGKHLRLLLIDANDIVVRATFKLGISVPEMEIVMRAIRDGFLAMPIVQSLNIPTNVGTPQLALRRGNSRSSFSVEPPRGSISNRSSADEDQSRSFPSWLRFLDAMTPIIILLATRNLEVYKV